MITEETSVPRKSANYLFAESVFYEQFNKVHFYFEDAKKEEMYFSVLKKLFPNIEFAKVFGLNGKDSVIEKAEKSINRKNRVFIVDKDFGDILGKKRDDLPNLFYLERYSIENYLFEEDAIKMYIISQIPTLNRNNVKLQFDRVKRKIIKELKLLTCCFLVAHKNRIPHFESCSLPLEKFTVNRNPTEIDSRKIMSYKRSLRLGLLSIRCPNTYTAEMNEAKLVLKFDKEDVFNNIPGKHCIKLLMKILKAKYPSIGNLEFNRFSYGLVERCMFEPLKPVKTLINKYLKSVA